MDQTSPDRPPTCLAPPMISLTPTRLERPRLSSRFSSPSPCPQVEKTAWISLQGRLVNAEEASSARTIKGGLSPEEKFFWELFTPIERFLIVAVLGVAVNQSKKNRDIFRLRKSVQLRDQVLSSMQQKLDDLCEQLNTIRDQQQAGTDVAFLNNIKTPSCDAFGNDKIKIIDCGCWLCEQHYGMSSLLGSSHTKLSNSDEVLQYKISANKEAEPEERRMSELSDWASSVASYADVQMNLFTTEQDICHLKREREEKDAIIEELTTLLHSADIAGSKRIAELEDVIRRKNMIITKLRKDMAVLEQKVVQLTRLRRPSSVSVPSRRDIPLLTDNILYNMDSTSPSSSDSDSPPANQLQTPVAKLQEIESDSQILVAAKSVGSGKQNKEQKVPLLPDPLKEISPNQKCQFESSRQKTQPPSGDYRRSRRRSRNGVNDTTPKKRWV